MSGNSPRGGTDCARKAIGPGSGPVTCHLSPVTPIPKKPNQINLSPVTCYRVTPDGNRALSWQDFTPQPFNDVLAASVIGLEHFKAAATRSAWMLEWTSNAHRGREFTVREVADHYGGGCDCA
jgi:hypothetical protein